jgi:hypothetical protein
MRLITGFLAVLFAVLTFVSADLFALIAKIPTEEWSVGKNDQIALCSALFIGAIVFGTITGLMLRITFQRRQNA